MMLFVHMILRAIVQQMGSGAGGINAVWLHLPVVASVTAVQRGKRCWMNCHICHQPIYFSLPTMSGSVEKRGNTIMKKVDGLLAG
jgi:hypothetical protein